MSAHSERDHSDGTDPVSVLESPESGDVEQPACGEFSFELDVISDERSHPCDGCHSGCCRAFAVPLTLSDLLRISAAEQLNFWDFVVRWADPDGAISRGQAPHFYFEDEPETPFVIGLMHEPSTAFPGSTRCRFLEEGVGEDGRVTGRCGIYESRPMGCRIFPAVILPTGEAGIAPIPESGRTDDDSDAYRLCSTEWSVDDLGPDDSTRLIDECRREMQLMSLLATRWNQDPGPWPLFPEFLRALVKAGA